MAKRYIDKSIEEQQAERADGFSRRLQNIADVGSDMYGKLSGIATGLAKEEVFGIPGLLGDLAEPAAAIMNPVLYGSNPEIRENLSEFQKDFGAVGLAKAAGVELSDEFLDEKGELRPEMVGRMLAPGALYTKGAALLPELSAGVQSLVRGLKNDGFFPAGGPQPATVSGPSYMTQAPDAAGPRSSVLMSESLGAGRSVSDESQKTADEIYDYVVGMESPDAISQLLGQEARESATSFLQQARGSDKLLDTVSPEILRTVQARLRDDTQAALADHLGIDIENLSFDTPVTVYRVGDIKKGEVQSYSLAPEIGKKELPGQRGGKKQPTVEYKVRAGDILAMPQASARGIKNLGESEVLIEGGRAQTPVQFEKEDMFVSPDNPAVVESGPPDFAGNALSGVSETGVYLPVRAALMNIDIPEGGIAANKLLEKLRGQPRAGSELRATGFADFLKGKGTEKLNRDQIDLVYDGLSPAPVIRTIMSEPYRYAGQDVSGTSFGYSGMQRQIGAEETELNYGVMLFGDEKNVVDGTATKTVEGHQYFDRYLPSTFGHVRFSIQTILDPETRQPIKVMLVEEIQSDLVRAFAGADRARRSVKSVDRIKKDLVKENPDLADDDAALTLMAESQREQELANVDGVVSRLLDNKAVYGPGEKLADATLDIHPDVAKYKGMSDQVKLAEDGDRILTNPVMVKLENTIDLGFQDRVLDDAAHADSLRFILQNNIHQAKSEEEATAILTSLHSRGVELPRPISNNRAAEEVNLNPSEIAAERIKSLAKETERFRKKAEKKVVSRQESKPTGIMANIADKIMSPSIEQQLTEDARVNMLDHITYLTKQAEAKNAALRLYRKHKDKLLEARQKNLDGNETESFYDSPNLDSGRDIKPDSSSLNNAQQVRKELTDDEIMSVIGEDAFAAEIEDAARIVGTKMKVLNDSDRVFKGATERYNDFNYLKEMIAAEASNALTGRRALELAQADRYKNSVINKVADAKENAPTPSDMVRQISKILDDEQGVGDLFRRRYNLDNDTTAMDIAANPQILAENMLDAEDYISRPPFETQNDFNQFAMRAIASEAKKLEVDAVVVPSVEEMVMARAEHGTVATGRNGVKQIEDFKKGLVQEKQVKAAIQKLRSMDKDKVLTTEDVEALGISDMSDLNIARYGMPEKPAEFIAALENSYINMGGGRVDHLRGHFQNYGESLNAALSNLKREGFDVTELEVLNARKPFVAGYTPLGEYAKQGAPELAKYRMIDLREGKKGADVAKKVPSLYNKGGHVDVRGGIGAMARSVM